MSQQKRSTLEVLSWIAGIVSAIIAAIVFLYPRVNSNSNATPPSVELNATDAKNQIGTVGGNVTIYNSPVSLDNKRDIRDFKKFVPQTYLDNLTKVKYNAYVEARKYWDTGVTAQMIEGSNILSDRLMDILINLADTAYTEDNFEGKSVRLYYDQKVKALAHASYDSQPEDQGPMHSVIANGEFSKIIDDYVVRIVRDVSEPSYFQVWNKKWNRARELANEGVQVDLDTTSEL